MSRKLRFTLLVGALLLTLLLLCSCTNGDTNVDGADTTTTNDTGLLDGAVTLDPENIIIKKTEDNTVNFKIIRPDAATSADMVVKVAQDIRNGMSELLEASAMLGNDFIRPGDSHDSSTYEILVGCTTYPETESVYEECGYGDYIIKVVDNKIVVLSYSNNGLTIAANALIDAMEDAYNETTKEIVLKASVINTKQTINERLSVLPVYEDGTFEAYYDAGIRISGSQCDEIIIKDTTPDAYSSYLTDLQEAQFTQYTTNDVNGNKFATYTNSKYTVNVGYYAYEKSTRILVEPLAPATGLKSENVYTERTTSQITMLGLEYYTASSSEYTSNGLAILIRLTDGRFIVVDGGFNRSDCANQLRDTIKAQTPTGCTPTIAAWIITHAHGDHHGVFVGKASTITNAGIKVEKVLTNIMSETERKKGEFYTANSGEGSGGSSVLSAAKDTYKATVYKIHVGQKFYFADCEMEILYTLESLAPKACDAFNTTSSVIKMTFDGKTSYLCTGDATGYGMEIAAKTYGTAMQCDIVQVCHHGYTTWGNDAGVIAGYSAANATLVLWPQGLNAFPNYRNKAYNAVLFTLSNFKECYVAGSMGDKVIITLPYEYGVSAITGNVENKRT